MLIKNLIAVLLIAMLLLISGCALLEEPERNLPQTPPQERPEPEPEPPKEPVEAVEEPGLAGLGGISLRDLPEPVAEWFEERKDIKGAYVYQHPDHVYIMIAAGEKPTGGHKIDVKDINLEDFPRVITIEFVPPAPEAIVTQAITYPSFVMSVVTDTIADYVVKTVDDQELTVEDKIIVAAIDIPKKDELLENPMRLKGKIAAFEAMFVARIYDADDNLLEEQILMSDGGGPMWGRFDVEIEYQKPNTNSGRVEIGEFSAEDGSYKLRESVDVRFR